NRQPRKETAERLHREGWLPHHRRRAPIPCTADPWRSAAALWQRWPAAIRRAEKRRCQKKTAGVRIVVGVSGFSRTPTAPEQAMLGFIRKRRIQPNLRCKQVVQFGMRGVLGEAIKATFGQFTRGAQEATPRCAGQRTTDADTTYAEPGKVGERVRHRTPHQHVDRLGRNGVDDRANLFRLAAPGAYRQSAPASAYARKRFKDSFNGSAWPVRKHSARPINITSSPVASIAARAARIRATASPKSYNGCDGSPVESSIDNPATPVSTQRLTFFFRPSMSRAWPSSKSAFTGRSVASTISRQCASTASISIVLSAFARDHAKPELVVASALKPSAASACAEPASQGFGIRKQPDSCSLRNAARRADHFDVFIAPA